ncbi:MAG: hypothetical protein ACTHXC_00330 [Brachybacterium sp.]
MSKGHEYCSHIKGKYACPFDSELDRMVLEWDEGDGHVEAPTGWWASIGLVDGDVISSALDTDRKLITHYGTRWLIARTNGDGLFWVETYETVTARDARVDELEDAYVDWDPDALTL